VSFREKVEVSPAPVPMIEHWRHLTGKQSPDAFIQMALQLAWYKTRHGLTATYETASTRMFLHGRTEVIRTLSEPSRAFVHAMVDPKRSVRRRVRSVSGCENS
jgi:carnitine O-acetyltransferase